MKLELQYTKFEFKDTETSKIYTVMCPPGKLGDNLFYIYIAGEKVARFKPQGGHINKTTALHFLKKHLEQK